MSGAERHSGIPHFDSKWQIEQHLRALDIPLTVLRPTLFIDNFATVQRPGLDEAGELVVRLPIPPRRPLQMVATTDIGRFAADAFEDPASSIGTAAALAGDELTGPEIAATFHQVTGLPARSEQQPLDQVRAFDEDLGLMFGWLSEHGYRADIGALRRRHPDWSHSATGSRRPGGEPTPGRAADTHEPCCSSAQGYRGSQGDRHRSPADRGVGHPTSVAAVHPRRTRPAPRTAAFPSDRGRGDHDPAGRPFDPLDLHPLRAAETARPATHVHTRDMITTDGHLTA